MLLDLRPGPLVEPLTGRRWPPEEVLARVATRASAHRAAGLGAGHRVFLHHGNTPEFFVDLLAVWALGACAVPVDPRLTPFEVERLAEAAAPRLAIFRGALDPDLAGRLEARHVLLREAEAEPPRASSGSSERAGGLRLDDDALILFTSGTTGTPKGVVHTHRSLRARWTSLAEHLGLRAFRRTLCLLPTHFGHGLVCNALFPWLGGQTLHVVPPFQPDLVMQLGALLDEHEITFLSSVPSVWRLALRTARPPAGGSLERVFCGSAPLSAHLWRQIQAFTGTDAVWNAYGITETGSWLAGTSLPDLVPEDGLVGHAWGGVVRVLDTGSTESPPAAARPCAPGETGHVWVNTPALMRGYLGREDWTRGVVRDGWFATGDVGALDERGRLYLRGREREEINKGGSKVHPGDVDAVAERFPDVDDVCSFALEDPHYGQDVGIALVLARSDAPVLRELHAWLKEHLADHQRPVRWYLLQAIPRTSRGKVNRAAVAEACASRSPVDLRAVLRGP